MHKADQCKCPHLFMKYPNLYTPYLPRTVYHTLTSLRTPHPTSPQLRIHTRPPPRPKPSHGPHDRTARGRNDPQSRKQPAVPNGIQQRLRNHPAHAGEDISHKVIHRHAGGCLLGHELRQHGRHHGEDEHAADAEEEVGDELESRVVSLSVEGRVIIGGGLGGRV